ncbi:MAG: thiamine-monophosphate kinase [Pseudoalteromonas tetraodonis]|jgi:thiamine-monophosphate kinase
MAKLSEIGEDALIEQLTARLHTGKNVIAGAGQDDCAIIRNPANPDVLTLLKTDCIVEGVHYLPDTPPSKVGWKAMARAISDIAAMGGIPEQALVTLVIQPDREVAYVRGLYKGLEKAARDHNVSIVGGETASCDSAAMISISLTGHVEKKHCTRRSTGRPGDTLYVTGLLGGSIGGRHLTFRPRLAEARWLATHFNIRAMMDLSDGLAKDLPRLAKSSATGFQVDPEKLPCQRGCSIEQAACDGEDYELLFAIGPRDSRRLAATWPKKFPKLPLTKIGYLTKNGVAKGLEPGGWEHFL